jgi:hypothetical protein
MARTAQKVPALPAKMHLGSRLREHLGAVVAQPSQPCSTSAAITVADIALVTDPMWLRSLRKFDACRWRR